jgi:endonuclease/exonuclease/phosphatase family metal-dependent hydrolase
MADPLSILTINILSDLSRWQQRKDLLAEQIAAFSPDVVALQEVHLSSRSTLPNPAEWLAASLGYTHLMLTPKMNFEANSEAIAILSRSPFVSTGWLDLGSQNRVAQYARLGYAGQEIVLANGHFYWQPGESSARMAQIERLLTWLHAIPARPPCIVCGDFNSTPETRPIQRMRQEYYSAYEAIHGSEPEYTCPTPLPRSSLAVSRTLLGFIFLLRPRHLNLRWRGVLDYIFVDPRLHVLDCQVALNQPSPTDARIYPSDHFGLFTTLVHSTSPNRIVR